MAVTYRHVTARPDMLAGDILPKVDGTGATAVPRFENIVALTSMVRDVAYFARPDKDVNTYVKNYDRDDFTLSTKALRQIHEACRTGFSVTTNYGVIRADWEPRASSLTAQLNVSGPDAWTTFLAAEKEYFDVPRCSDERKLLQTLAGDDIRRPYYDLKRMRRFFMQCTAFGSGIGSSASTVNWDGLINAIRNGGSNRFIGPFLTEEEGKCTYSSGGLGDPLTVEYEGCRLPLFERVYDDNGGVEYANSLTGSYAFGVIYPYDGSTLSNSSPTFDKRFGLNLDVYVMYGISYSIHDPAQGNITKGGNILVRIRSGSKTCPSSGSKLRGRIQGVYEIDFALPQIFLLAENAINAHESGWSEKRRYLHIGEPSIVAVDSGIVQNYFQKIPDTWTWTPPD